MLFVPRAVLVQVWRQEAATGRELEAKGQVVLVVQGAGGLTASGQEVCQVGKEENEGS